MDIKQFLRWRTLSASANQNIKHALHDAVIQFYNLPEHSEAISLLPVCLNKLREGDRETSRSVTNFMWFSRFEAHHRHAEIEARRSQIGVINVSDI